MWKEITWRSAMYVLLSCIYCVTSKIFAHRLISYTREAEMSSTQFLSVFNVRKIVLFAFHGKSSEPFTTKNIPLVIYIREIVID